MAKTTDTGTAKRSHALTVLYASGAMFVILMALLVYRLEAGLDPSIGTAGLHAPAAQQRKLVVERRVVEVIRDAPVAVASSGQGGAVQGSGSGSVSGSGGPASSSPAAPAAPQASTPAPAPAPAPAPVTKAS